jgi:DNA-directed RNA polymerase specialized sigma subunit
LVWAASAYDPARNVKFATFARHRIMGELLDVKRKAVLTGWEDNLEIAPVVVGFDPYYEEKGRVLWIEPNPPVEQDSEAIAAVERLLRKLPKHHAAVCREIYIHRRTLSEAGAALGFSKSRLGFIHRDALRMLNEAYRRDNQLVVDDENRSSGDENIQL